MRCRKAMLGAWLQPHQSGRINSVRNGTDLTDSTKLEILNLTQLIHLHFHWERLIGQEHTKIPAYWFREFNLDSYSPAAGLIITLFSVVRVCSPASLCQWWYQTLSDTLYHQYNAASHRSVADKKEKKKIKRLMIGPEIHDSNWCPRFKMSTLLFLLLSLKGPQSTCRLF